MKNKDIKTFLQVFILIGVFAVFIFLYLVMSSYINTMRKTERNEIYDIFIDDLEIGDVIAVAFDNMFSPFTQGFSRLRYIHPVIVCKKGNERYVLELMEYGFDPTIKVKKEDRGKTCNTKKEEMHMIPLTRWFEINRNYYFQCHKLEKENGYVIEESERTRINDMIWNYYENNKSIKLADVSRYLNPFKKPISQKDKKINNTFFCYETVGEIFVNLGMMEEDEIGKNFDDIKMLNEYKFKSFKIGMKTIKTFGF